MDRSEYERLKATVEARKAKRVSDAEEECAASLRSIEDVWRLSQQITGETSPEFGLRPVAANSKNGKLRAPATVVRKGIGSPTAVVRQLAKNMPADFGHHEIAAGVQKHFGIPLNSKAISSALNKLNQQGEIIQTAKGVGRRPAVYRYVGPVQETKHETQKPLGAS